MHWTSFATLYVHDEQQRDATERRYVAADALSMLVGLTAQVRQLSERVRQLEEVGAMIEGWLLDVHQNENSNGMVAWLVDDEVDHIDAM